MSTTVDPADVAAFLRDITEATSPLPQTVRDETRHGFVVWCSEADPMDGVASPVLEQPRENMARFLEVAKPGRRPGPEPVEPKAPTPPGPRPGPPPPEPRRPAAGLGGQLDPALERRYQEQRERFEEAVADHERSVAQHEEEEERYEEALLAHEEALGRYRDAKRKFDADLARWKRHHDIYDDLFAARNPPDALELVVGIGLLAGRSPQGELRRHMITAPATVELDRRTGVLTVEVIDATDLEINWIPGDVRRRVVEEGGGLDDLARAETLTDVTSACEKVTASFGLNSMVLHSHAEVGQAGSYGVGPHPAVLLRKRDSSALLDLLAGMAEDISAGGHVSEPFRMIVDPRFEPSNRAVEHERPALPLPANTDQRTMIDRARVEPHMVIQGPPGTGKTHTIANLAAVLMAEGRRVLITAENERALMEVQSKLPPSMRPLLLPMLRERGTGPLASSVNELMVRAGSAKSEDEQKADIDARVRALEVLQSRIEETERRLAGVARADQEERSFGNTKMKLSGHLQALATQHVWLGLIDRYLSEDGRAGSSAAEALIELTPIVDEQHRGMLRFVLPEDLMAPGDLNVWLQEHRGALAVLGDPGAFDHSGLAPRLEELERLARVLNEVPPTSWSDINGSSAEYAEAATECASVAGAVDLGVTIESASDRPAAMRLLDTYLDLDPIRFDRPILELLQEHAEAATHIGLSATTGSFGEVARSADLTRSAREALDLLDRDRTGLLAVYVEDQDLHGRSRISALVVEAADLVQGSRAPLGLPVLEVDGAPPPHEALRQAEGLRDHLASGGKLGRLIGVPRPVKDAAQLLEHVTVDGSEIDTLEEAERVVAYYTHRRALSLIDSWAQQHQMVRPEGMDHHSWLSAIADLDARRSQVREAVDLVRATISFPLGAAPSDPSELLRAALASVAAEVVARLGALAECANGSAAGIRVDGVPVRSRADASRARAALDAAEVRERHRSLLPEVWREHADPSAVTPDALVDLLGIASASAAVPGPVRTADLSPAAVRKIIERTDIDARRAALLADHTEVIGGLRRKIAGCVPTSPASAAIDAALVAEDAERYRAAVAELDRERVMADRARQLAGAEAALAEAHPDLFAAFQVADPEARRVLSSLDELQDLRDHRAEVMRWKDEIGSTEEIHQELSDLHAERRRSEATIADMRCWSSAIARIRHRRDLRSALSALTTTMDKVPKTRTAKSYPARMRAVRDATKTAAPAIPCWVMPIDRVAEVLGYPTGEDRFDVVIVDEASQAWFNAAFLYSIAEQVIIVGDDLQTSPAAQILNEDILRSVVNEHISGHRLANQVGADLSLYDVASVMTGPDVMVDHFRCVPEIIELSNRLSYEPKGKPLLPSRVREPGSLVPIHHVQVEGQRRGYEANEVEARALVEAIIRCHADPAYAGMDFGVIVLGANPTGHIRFLRELLLETMGPAAMADRNIEVGTSAEFQGSERNVMFLSLVEAPVEGTRLRIWPHEHTGQNRRRVQQLNVAVSRARDQLWIFRSFGTNELAPNDVRSVILHEGDQDFPSLESQLEKCDSQFERDVVIALSEADPDVKIRTQVRAIGYLIDIVAEDDAGHRLAIECDGDRWHGSDAQIRRDLHRQRTLEDIGWQFERFLASEWYADPEGRTKRILDRLHALGEVARTETQVEPSEPPSAELHHEAVAVHSVEDPASPPEPAALDESTDASAPPIEPLHTDDAYGAVPSASAGDRFQTPRHSDLGTATVGADGRHPSSAQGDAQQIRTEILACEKCGKRWSRVVTRGRKPRFCNDCR